MPDLFVRKNTSKKFMNGVAYTGFMAELFEFLKGIYRISTFPEGGRISFNQYLIRDEKTTLVHTGSMQIFDGVFERIKEVVDPREISYVFISHFESDECGALRKLLDCAKNILPVCSEVTGRQLSGFGITSNVMTRKAGESLDLGDRRLVFIGYPSEMHLWEGLLAWEEKGRVLFSSDLFTRPGREEKAVLKVDIQKEIQSLGEDKIPSERLMLSTVEKLGGLPISWIASGHGPILAKVE